MSFVFTPIAGLQCEDSYLHGAGNRDTMGYSGFIEYVGPDYFILRIFSAPDELPIIVYKKSYHAIQENDFEPSRSKG